MDASPGQHELLITCLRRLHQPADNLREYWLLQSGMSGAAVYHLHCTDADYILKLTLPIHGNRALARGRREWAFYHELADHVPLATPRVVASSCDSAGIALLFPVYHTSPAPARWTTADYCQALRQLGQLHGTFWNMTEQVSHLPWLQPRRHLRMATDMRQAITAWQALHSQPHFTHILTPPRYRWICRVVDNAPLVDRVFEILPLTLCHGDCITLNVLRDNTGQFIWTDWQEVCLARGAEDLAFFLHRAKIAGATVAEDEIVATYHHALEATVGLPVAETTLRQVMAAAEWWSRVLHWPAYLTRASDVELTAMLDQIAVLTAQLDIEP